MVIVERIHPPQTQPQTQPQPRPTCGLAVLTVLTVLAVLAVLGHQPPARIPQ